MCDRSGRPLIATCSTTELPVHKGLVDRKRGLELLANLARQIAKEAAIDLEAAAVQRPHPS